MKIRIGERIGIVRRRQKISQTELGRRVGYSLNGIAKIERGESDPKLSVLLRIAQALDTDCDFILTGQEPLYKSGGIMHKLTEEEREAARSAQYFSSTNWGKDGKD